jgi:hypothetical protein
MSFHRNSSFHPAEQWYAQPLSSLPTPSVVIDRAVFVRNSARMLEASRKFGMEFRIHIKTHKTSEGTRIQLDPFAEGDKAGKEQDRLRATRLIVSTVEESWMLVNSGVLRECGVKSVRPRRYRISSFTHAVTALGPLLTTAGAKHPATPRHFASRNEGRRMHAAAHGRPPSSDCRHRQTP